MVILLNRDQYPFKHLTDCLTCSSRRQFKLSELTHGFKLSVIYNSL